MFFLFNYVLLTVCLHIFLLIAAPWRIFPRMAKKRKTPEFRNCKVSQSTNPRAPWRVFYTVEREGKPTRVFKSFVQQQDAYAFAESKEVEISNHGVRYGDIPAEVRRAFDYFRDQSAELRKIGCQVPTFENLVSKCLAGIRTAHEAKEKNQITVAEGVEQFLAYKASRVKERQIINLKTQLKRFAQDYGTDSMNSITTAQIESWLASLRSRKNPEKNAEPALLGALARNHYRATIHAFFKHGATPARAWNERNPVADLEPEKVEAGEPQAYNPEIVAKLMQAALDHKPELVPVIALGMFAGLRVSEAIIIDLDKLPRKAGEEFRVTGKTGARMATLTEAAAAWLAAQPRRKGKAWEKSPRMLVDAMQELFRIAAVDAIDNGARHSYISYRTAETRDVARVADECGNSVSTIKNHYRQLVTSEQAARFFAIRPESEASRQKKIVFLKGGKSA